MKNILKNKLGKYLIKYFVGINFYTGKRAKNR